MFCLACSSDVAGLTPMCLVYSAPAVSVIKFISIGNSDILTFGGVEGRLSESGILVIIYTEMRLVERLRGAVCLAIRDLVF